MTIDEFDSLKKFARSAKRTFIKRQGLSDLDEFERRKKIIDHSYEVAMVEHFDPDNYRDFLGSLGRFAYVAKDYVELAMQVYHSENFRIVRDRVRATPTTTYIKRAFNSYGDIATLFYDE